jgi:eukaryotic-like serine/threonine-protein kinase
MPERFLVGEAVGDYRILGVLGSGGSGEVFKAEHTITKRIEALKVLSYGRPRTLEDEQRFLREIQLQATLDHPNVAGVHNAFWTDSGLVLAMELAEGESLETILGRGRIPLAAGLQYILQTLSALMHAHGHGVIHRDIKPGNIVVTPKGIVKLTDFGLAKGAETPRVTSTGVIAGSPYYMSPEQIAGSSVDARSDIYSLGVVLYETVTGEKPFTGDSAFAIMLTHKNGTPVPPLARAPEIGRELNQVILTALAVDPGNRFQSAADFRSALDAARITLRLSPGAGGDAAAEKKPMPKLGADLLRAAGVLAAGMLGVLLGMQLASPSHAPIPVQPAVTQAPVAAPAPAPAPAAVPFFPAPDPALAPAVAEPAAVAPTAPPVAEKKAAVRARARRTPRAKQAPESGEVTVVVESAESPGQSKPAVAPAAEAAAPSPAWSPAPVAAANETSPAPPSAAQPGAPAKPEATPAPKRLGRWWRALGKVVRRKPAESAPAPEQPSTK